MDTVGPLEIRNGFLDSYRDVLTPKALDTLAALAPFEAARQDLMRARIERRLDRFQNRRRIGFLDAAAAIAGTKLTVADAREGRFEGSEIPGDLQRQWIQGTGPASRPRSTLRETIRNVAYALLSGADGWMFDGEDALGQVDSMSLDNQRSLRLALAFDPSFLDTAEQVAGEMNAWARGFLGRPIVDDWRRQLEFTTRLFRPRGLHLDDRHLRLSGGGR
ncbi:MAG: hypothetical protein HY303_22200 [Candidatus Wallbacteria bacterium]|nr:hypothetical protein [Candidatus Wallbacteria bacterium]